jgi:hypothetical protein
LKLPSEVRCLILEQVFLDIVEGAEMVAFTKQLAGRAYQSVPLREQINAMPHTCRIFRKECAPIYEKISYMANHSRIMELEDMFSDDSLPPTSGSPCDRSQELEDYNNWSISAHGLGPPEYESQVTTAVCRMRAAGDILRVAMRIDENIAYSQGRRRNKAILANLRNISIGVQNMLHDGVGVRTAFEAEFGSHYQIGVEDIDDLIAILLRFYVGCFAILKIVQRLDKRARAPGSGRVLKRRWRQPRRTSRGSYQQSVRHSWKCV